MEKECQQVFQKVRSFHRAKESPMGRKDSLHEGSKCEQSQSESECPSGMSEQGKKQREEGLSPGGCRGCRVGERRED